jgi:hypothetical protein
MRLEARLHRLEGGAGWCSCSFAVYVNGRFHRATLCGEQVTEEEFRAYTAQGGPDRTCPLCGLPWTPRIRTGRPSDTRARPPKSREVGS